jgi:hypothetical protein
MTTGDAAAINAICTGATICAEDSLSAGIGALRSQHGATGAEPCGMVWLILAQCAQPAMAVEAGDMQSASPSAGANSTVRSNPDAMSLRNCMTIYTPKAKPRFVTRITAAKLDVSVCIHDAKKPHAFA